MTIHSSILLFLSLCSIIATGRCQTQQELLDSARQTWSAASGTVSERNYSFSYEEATAGITGKIVNVRNGVVAYVDSELLSFGEPLDDPKDYPLVDEIFDMIQDALDTGTKLTATYDETYGYPTRTEFSSKLMEIYFLTHYTDLQKQLDESMELWGSKNPSSYECILQRSCFCFPEYVQPQLLTVENGVVKKAINQETGDVATSGDLFDGLETVPDVFQLIQESISSFDVQIFVDFNADFGYPTSFSSVPDLRIADGSTSYSISEFKVLGEDSQPTDSTGSGATAEQEELDDARDLWKATNGGVVDHSSSYIFGYIDTSIDDTERIINVRDGTISSVTTIFGSFGEPQDDPSGFPVIEDLFDVIQQAIDDGSKFGVTYNKLYGYPSTIQLSAGTIDVPSLTHYSNLQTQLDEAMAVWEGKDASNYEYVLTRICFCTENYVMPQLVTVEGGVVTKAVNQQTGQVTSGEIFDGLETVPEVFALIQDSISSFDVEINTEYDSEFGHPKLFAYEPSKGIADAGKSYEIAELQIVAVNVDPVAGAGFDFVADDLAAHQDLWESQNWSTYTFVFQRFCECLEEEQTPKTIEVVNGAVVAINGEPTTDLTRSTGAPPTIEDLFVTIDEAINGAAFDVQVTYDDILGYPIDILIDYDETTADDEFIATATLVEGSPAKKETEMPTGKPTPAPAPIVETAQGNPTAQPVGSRAPTASPSEEDLLVSLSQIPTRRPSLAPSQILPQFPIVETAMPSSIDSLEARSSLTSGTPESAAFRLVSSTLYSVAVAFVLFL